MRQALKLAQNAAQIGEVPVGALIVTPSGEIIGEGFNQKEGLKSSLAHAEMLAIEQACQKLGTWRLHGCTMYVTLEPCPMCSGAIWASQMGMAVFGAFDKKTGYLSSLYTLGDDQRLNHRFESVGGVLEEECSQILKDFFKSLRKGANRMT